MIDLLIALFCVVLFMATHILGFRLRLFKFQTPVLLGLLFFWLGVCWISMADIHQRYESTQGFWHIRIPVSACLAYFVIGLWYISQMTVIQYGSPSLTIMDLIARYPVRNEAERKLREIFTNENLILSRLNDLVAHEHVALEGDRYLLRGRGALLVRIVHAYRTLLGREAGG